MLFSDITGSQRRAPVEFQDAVELWARQWGRHGRIEWHPLLGAWCVHLERRASDPMMKAYREGALQQAGPPTESFILQAWDNKKRCYVSQNLDELGVSGLLNILDEANTWSGRAGSLQEMVEKTVRHNNEVRERARKSVDEAGKEVGWLARRKVHELPLIRSAGLPQKKSPPTPTNKE